VLSNFKRWAPDIFHGVSPAHLQAYLDEYCYRLNRRQERQDLFRRILNRCLLYTEPATYCLLTAG
jgi:ISXO2-like transposase domain